MREAIEYAAKKQFESYKESFENPVSKKYLDFLEAGGDPSRFMETYAKPDYSRLTAEIITDNEDLQKKLVEEEMRSEGDDDETIAQMIKVYEERGVLEAQALRAHKKGIKRQEAEREALVQQAGQQKQQAEQARAQAVEQISKDIMSRNEIGGFKLTDKVKRQFVDYMVKPDKQGLTQLQKDAQDPDKQLLMAYLYHINFDFSALSKEVKTQVNTKLLENLGNVTKGKSSQTSKETKPKGGTVDQDVLKNWLQ
jgi:hypothetical protein